MERYLKKPISRLIRDPSFRKVLFLSGPRQVGKTTLSQALIPDAEYFNYDITKDRDVFVHQKWNHDAPLIIFDELHKKKKWKLWLKGLYDQHTAQKILVTGSAKLETAKKIGDSLAGRFYSFRLHPLDLKELREKGDAMEIFKKLLERGGFPEPFFAKTDAQARLWRRSHLDAIIRQDILSLETVRDLDGIETLVELLSERVGSTISVNSLARDLDRDPKTLARWIKILEDFYIVFRVLPFSKNIARAKKKQAKIYFFDCGRVRGDQGAKIENAVALALRKELDRIEDTEGYQTRLSFLQNKDQREIDFRIEVESHSPVYVEVKSGDTDESPSFSTFREALEEGSLREQWVLNLEKAFTTRNGVRIRPLLDALAHLDLLRKG